MFEHETVLKTGLNPTDKLYIWKHVLYSLIITPLKKNYNAITDTFRYFLCQLWMLSHVFILPKASLPPNTLKKKKLLI